jgi:hypothetical protein
MSMYPRVFDLHKRLMIASFKNATDNYFKPEPDGTMFPTSQENYPDYETIIEGHMSELQVDLMGGFSDEHPRLLEITEDQAYLLYYSIEAHLKKIRGGEGSDWAVAGMYPVKQRIAELFPSVLESPEAEVEAMRMEKAECAESH